MGLKVNTTQHQKHDEKMQPYPLALETPFSFMSTKALWLRIQLDVRLVSLSSDVCLVGDCLLILLEQ